MEILESKMPVPQVVVEEEVKEEEEVREVPVLPKEKSEEEYNIEMAAKIKEMGILVSKVDLLSPSVPEC